MSAFATRERISTSVVDVDLDAVAANTRLLTGRAGNLTAVVKADGFGLGAVQVARTALAAGASRLGVTSIEEALELQAAGLRAPMLSWLNPVASDWPAAIAAGVEIAVPSREHLAAVVLAARAMRVAATVHLYADCGLARDGAPVPRWWPLVTAAHRAARRGEIVVRGLMGHLAMADSGPDVVGRETFRRFVAIARRAGHGGAYRHLAATSATLTDPASRFDGARVGAGLVGIDPSRTTPLAATARWTAPVLMVRDVPAGTGIGYGHAAVTSTRTRLATLPVGYADGVPRVARGAQVQLHGRRCDIVGRVSMDQVVVDVGDLPVEAGHRAVLFGSGDAGEPTLREWADWAETLEHEILTGLGTRVTRAHRGGVGAMAVPA